MKIVVKYLALSLLFYIIYTIFFNLFNPPTTGFVTLEEVASYYIPKQIEVFDRQRQKVAEIIFDEIGNQLKSSGSVPTGAITVYYKLAQSRKKFMDGVITEGKLDGPAKIYYPNGKIWVEANYKAGKLNGQIIEYYTPVKSLKRTTNFDRGLRQGTEKKYYTSGKIFTESNYQTNKLQGKYQVFYEKGKVLEESNYQNGLKAGESKSYYPSGKLYAVTNYQQGVLSGGYTTYYESGQIKDKGRISELPKDRSVSFYSDIVAPVAEYDSGKMFRLPEKNVEFGEPPAEKKNSGQSSAERKATATKRAVNSNYAEDSFQGVEIQTRVQTADVPMQTNYQKQSRQQNERIIKDGSSVAQFDEGFADLKEEKLKMNERVVGQQFSADRVIRGNGSDPAVLETTGRAKIKKYYPNGALYAELPYENGVVSGKARFFYENGRVKAEINFADNRKEGFSKTYFQNGRIESETVFMDDAPVSKKIYSEEGRLIYSW